MNAQRSVSATATEVEITGIAAGGEGVGRMADGRVVFVHRTAPGDRVRVSVSSDRKRWARGRLESILHPGPGRREPPCPHYGRCGGCALQHLQYAEQLRAKRRIVTDALQRIGQTLVDPGPVVPSPEEFRYRDRITVSMRRTRSGRVVVGFHELDRPGRIVNCATDCLLPVKKISRVFAGLEEAWGLEARRLSGGVDCRLTLRSIGGQVVLDVDGGAEGSDAHGILKDVPGLLSIRNVTPEGGEVVAGPGSVEEEWLGDRFEVGVGTFLQVNRAAFLGLHTSLLEEIGPPGGLRIVDAYCGVGLLGRSLARRGARVVGIELSGPAAAAGSRGAPEGFEMVRGAVEDCLGGALPADLVVLNPPRMGLHAAVPALLLDSRPSRILYVSCDPATLARDVERLVPAYGVTRARAFDLFPQTAHVEVLAVFEPH